MDLKEKTIVSMLAGEQKITLFTNIGEMLDLKFDGPYDTTKISEYLVERLTGGNTVDIDLRNFLAITSALSGPEYEDEGQIITQIVDGKEVQGIFYPIKVKVSIKHDGVDHEVPNIENLNKHIKRASDEKSPAVRNFLRRLAPVIASRLHSVEDLMKFIEKSELPLTNDGRIIGYKRVEKHGDDFVDCHTRKVVQNVGTRVWMDIGKVDPSRDRSCSQGLHVANLGYLGSFRGSHTLIVLVDPANFIAVPHNETTKCRVSEYDVIGVMSPSSHDVVNTGGHVEGDSNLKQVLQHAIDGSSKIPTRSVQVGTNGEILSAKSLTTNGEPIQEEVKLETTTTETKEASGKSLMTDTPEVAKEVVGMIKQTKNRASDNAWDHIPEAVTAVFDDLMAEELSKSKIAEKHATSTRTIGRWVDKYDYEGYVKVKTAKPEPEEKVDITLTVSEQARQMFAQAKFDALAAFKKAKKKGWASLGFSMQEVQKINSSTSG